jgi:hypothetical protein
MRQLHGVHGDAVVVGDNMPAMGCEGLAVSFRVRRDGSVVCEIWTHDYVSSFWGLVAR